jgi:hypothetical protein
MPFAQKGTKNSYLQKYLGTKNSIITLNTGVHVKKNETNNDWQIAHMNLLQSES